MNVDCALIIVFIVVVANGATVLNGDSNQSLKAEEMMEDKMIQEKAAEIKKIQEHLDALKKEKIDKSADRFGLGGINEKIQLISKARDEMKIVKLGDKFQEYLKMKELTEKKKEIMERIASIPKY